MKLLNRLTILIIILIIVGIVCVCSIRYYRLSHTDKIPIKNLRTLSSSDCFIFFNIKNKGKIYTVVCPNQSLYYGLKSQKWLPLPLYVYKIGRLMEKDNYFTVQDTLFNYLSGFILNEDLKYKYNPDDLLNDTTIINDGYINYHIDWEDKKVIIYELLKKEINCCYGSEAGMESVYLPSLKK